MFKAIDISYSGLASHKQLLEVTANNITNISTTRTEDGGPYKRQAVIFQNTNSFEDYLNNTVGNTGVKVAKIVQDDTVKTVYDPDHADADAEGNVNMPNIQLAAEMTNMMVAQRGYQASSTVLNATKEVMRKESEIGRG